MWVWGVTKLHPLSFGNVDRRLLDELDYGLLFEM